MSTNNINDPSQSSRAARPSSVFRKADLKPGDKKYTEVTAVQVTEAYIAEHGDRVVTKEQAGGQPIEVGQWVITKTEADAERRSSGRTTTRRRRSRLPVREPSSRSATSRSTASRVRFRRARCPTPMVELPEGGTLKVSWGEASGGPGSFPGPSTAKATTNIITATDLVNLGYTGTDDESVEKLADIAAKLS